MNLLGAALYDPATAASKSTASLLAMTAFDTTNLRLTVTVPSHGMLRIKMVCTLTGATTVPTILLGVLNGATVVGRQTPLDFPGTMNAATQSCPCIADFIVTGLTPGSITLDAAYAVQVVVASTAIKYGGPNNATGANAWGAFSFEIWDPQPMKTGLNGGVNVTQWNGGAVPAPNVTGVPIVDDKYLLGTQYVTPATAGIQDVNVKNIANVAAALDANNFLKVDVEDWKGSAAPANTGDAFARIGAAGAGLTALGDTRIANLDATVSSRLPAASYTAPDNTRPANFTSLAITATGKVDVNDKTGFSLSAAGIQAIWDALTSALTTVGSIGKLLVSNIDAAISSRSTYAGGDTAGTTTLLGRLTSGRATNLDNLDAAVSSRLAAAGYTAPDNANIAAIAAKLPVNTIADETLVIAATNSILSDTGAIKAKTNNLPANPAATTDIPTAVQNADALLTRDMSSVVGEALRSPLNALRMLRNKFSTTAHAGKVTVYKEDDITEAFTKNLTTDPAATPITEG